MPSPWPMRIEEVGKGKMILAETKGALNDVWPSEFIEITPEIGVGRGAVPMPWPIRMEAEVIEAIWFEETEPGAKSSWPKALRERAPESGVGEGTLAALPIMRWL